MLAIGTRLEHFTDALRLQIVPKGALVRIIDQNAAVLSQSDSGVAWIGRDLGGFDSVTRHIKQRESSEIVTWPDEVARITGSATAHRVPWLISVGLSPQVAFDTVFSRMRWSVLFSLAAALSATTIALMFSTRLIRPLRELRSDTAVLAAGNFGHRAVINTGDEVEALAEAFNAMAASIQRREEEARETNETLIAVIDASPVAIICSDINRQIFIWSRAAVAMFGYTAEETLSQRTKLVAPEQRLESQELFDRAVKGETLRDLHLHRIRKDGSSLDVRVSATPMLYPNGLVRGVAWAYEDITEKKKAEENLTYLAHHDQLTGMHNRFAMRAWLSRKLSDPKASGPTSVILFDLDGFKGVNDSFGHSVGDHLLVEVGLRLVQILNNRGIVCRLGGDEFVVTIAACGDPLVCQKIANAMLERLQQPLFINSHALQMGASAGIAISSSDTTDAEELIANADLALYQAKSEGGNICRFFMPAYRASAIAKRARTESLWKAFKDNEFELYYQPIVKLADRRVVAAEALLRWHHPRDGLIEPPAFIDALASSSFAEQVGSWILREACGTMAGWIDNGLRLERIAVNVFEAQVRSGRLVEEVQHTLRATGLAPGSLELEITENIALNSKKNRVISL